MIMNTSIYTSKGILRNTYTCHHLSTPCVKKHVFTSPSQFQISVHLCFFFCRSAPLSRLVPRVQQYFGSRALGIKLTVTIPTSAKVSVSRATYLPKKLRKAPQKVPGSTKSYPSFQQCSFCFNLLFCVWSSLGPETRQLNHSTLLVQGTLSLAIARQLGIWIIHPSP